MGIVSDGAGQGMMQPVAPPAPVMSGGMPQVQPQAAPQGPQGPQTSGQPPAQGAPQGAPAPAPAVPGPVPSAGFDDDGNPDDLPEMDEYESEMSKAFLLNIKNYLFQGDGFDQAAQAILGAETPEQGVGELAGQLVTNEVQQAKAEGKEVPPGLIATLGAEVVHDLAEQAVAIKARAPGDEKSDQKFQTHALLFATKTFAEMNPDVDVEGVKKMAQQIKSGAYDTAPQAEAPPQGVSQTMPQGPQSAPVGAVSGAV